MTSKDDLVAELRPDLGEDRLLAIAAVVSARRDARKTEPSGFFNRIMSSKSVTADRLKSYLRSNLTSLKLKGILPQDFVEQQVTFQELAHHSVDAMIDFGFSWDHFMRMGLDAAGLQRFEFRHLKTLRACSKDILNAGPTIHDLLAMQMSPQQLHELGFRWHDLKAIGADDDVLPFSARDIDIYFGKPAREMQAQAPEQPKRKGRFKF